MLLERDDGSNGRGGVRPDDLGDAQAFFARLKQELLRAELNGRPLTVLLFELASGDRATPRDYIEDVLAARGHELLRSDCVAQLRDELAGALVPGADLRALALTVERGSVTVLAYPDDTEALEQLQRRRHPLLRRNHRRFA
jgi:hypothetical protein